MILPHSAGRQQRVARCRTFPPVPSRPYAAARLTVRDGVLTSLHSGTDAADRAAHVAAIAASQGAQVQRRATKVTIRTPEPEVLREHLVAELRALGVLATCSNPTEPGLPDVEIEVAAIPAA